MKFWANLLLSVFVATYSASSAHAYSKIELDAIANRLGAHEQLQAIFEQERVLKGFAKPLKSSGTMLIVKGKGILWHQQKPVEVAYAISDDRFVSKHGNSKAVAIDKESNEQVYYYSSMLAKLLQGDIGAIERNFVIEELLSGKQWHLKLRPSDSTLSKVFSMIELSGTEYISTVKLFDREGDQTEIRFSAYDYDQVDLNEYQEELLGK